MTKAILKCLSLALCISITSSVDGAQSRFFSPRQLSSSLVTSAIQDSKGFIWIGTEYGLNRFDGINMTEYYKGEDYGSLLDNSVRDIYCDNDGRVWIGMITGMQRYDHLSDSFSTVRFEGTTYTPNVSHIIQLESGMLWIIVSRLGIFEVDADTMTAKPLDSLKEMCGTDHFNNFHEDKHQRVWIGTDEDGIFCLDKSHKHVTQHRLTKADSERIDHIGETSNGVIVVACEGQIWMFDEVRQHFIPMEQPEGLYLNTTEMLLRNDGEFLIASSEHGLWKIDQKNQSIIRENFPLTADVNQEKANIVSLLEDKEGNLWCGHFQRGIVMVPPPTTIEDNPFNFWNLSTFEKRDLITDYGATSTIFKDSEGHIWCGTQDGTVFIIDAYGKPIRKYILETPATGIFEDSNGDIWIGTSNFGISSLNKRTGNLRHIPELSNRHVSTIIENNDKTLFIGTLGDGIWKYDLNTGSCRKVMTEDQENYRLLRNSYINKLMIDSKERLWICHFLGASCLDLKSGRFLEISTNPTLNSSVGYAVTESSDGHIWIGTNNGIFIWNDNDRNYRRYTEKDGLSSNMICGLVRSSDGNIWCSTFRGINCINKDDGKILGFNTSNGSSRQEFTQGVYYTDGNTIYFGDNHGVTSFTPPVATNAISREVFLTEMYLGNQKSNIAEYMKEDRDFKFPYKENTITLFFSTMSVRDADNIRFRYRLSGLDEEWYRTSYGSNSITYNHLPAGKYTLEICAEENSVLSHMYKWTIRIDRPWYRSLTAEIIYILILAGGIVSVYFGFRRKRREEANEKKLRYYVNMAHEIRSPMVMVMNPIEKLPKYEQDSEKRHVLNTMKRNSTRIIRLMNHFLDIKKIDKGLMTLQCREVNLVEIIQDLLETFAYEANKRSISIGFDYQLDRMVFNVDPDHIDTIIFNLITNALKYTPDGGEINVNLRMSDVYGNVMISVSDTGPGIEEKDIDRIFTRFYQTSNKQHTGNRGFGVGLNLCLMLAELHQGSIKAENRTDRSGTIFTLTLPTMSEERPTDAIAERPEPAQIHISINESVEKDRIEKKFRVKNTERILVIEDDEEIRLYLEEVLSPYYKIITARDGDNGLQRTLTEIPDMVISDIVMPGTNGLQIVKRIKNNPNTSHIPVILLTSSTNLETRIEGLEQGADAFMAKPFNIDELHMTIDSLLKNRQRIRGKYSGALQEDKIKHIEMKGNGDRLMERIMAVINDNLDNPELKVEMLSAEVGMSRAQLHRRIKEMTGISTGEFIRNIRLKKAAELLAEKKVNISQVAYTVGFSSQTHFSTAFRKFYGVSPTEYINKETKETISE